MVNINGFIPTQEIVNPDELIGRNKKGRELDKFIKSLIQNKSNIQLIAERRTGKSSILNCSIAQIKANKNVGNFIPLLINFKKYPSVNNVNNGYLLICAKLVNSLNDLLIWEKCGFIKKKKVIKIQKNKEIFQLDSIEGYYNYFITKEWRGAKLLEDLVSFLAKNNKSVVLLIDEYESMFFNTFEGIVGSVHTIRDLTMKQLSNEQIFRCAISGARSWDTYSQKIGSDDFNFIDDYMHLDPLTYEENIDLLKHCYNNSNGVCKENLSQWESKTDEIFKMSGGNPYIIKIIGNSFASNGKIVLKEIAQRLNSHFCNTWQRLNESEKKVLLNKNDNRRIQNDVISYGLAC
jgi:hypothetical protein